MTKLAWVTDIHLDVLQRADPTFEQFVSFGESIIANDKPECVIITGDISTHDNLIFHLGALERIIDRPIYFVLGNHDFYGSSIDETRREVKIVTGSSQYLRHMATIPYVSLSKKTALVGHDGWYDAGCGNVLNTNFVMNDWAHISEFALAGALHGGMIPDYSVIVPLAKKLAIEGMQHVANGIKAALKYHSTIIVMTHVPPFEEVHAANDRTADDGSLPWYTSKVMGDMLRQAAAANPHARFEVFAGHTHGKADVQLSKNLFCHVGEATYGHPQIQSMIQVP